MEDSFLLTSEELVVFRMKREHISNEKIAVELQQRMGTIYSTKNVSAIWKSIVKKSRANAGNRMFYPYVSVHVRIFNMIKEHYTEESSSVPVFNIDFADIDVFLNPEKPYVGNRFNIGFIYYMFNLKLGKERHRYCILPPTVWRLLNYIQAIYQKENKKDLFGILKDDNIKNFYDFIKEKEPSMDENNFEFDEKLMDLYFKSGHLLEIIKKIQRCVQDNDKLKKNLETIESMLDQAVIEPIDSLMNMSQVKIQVDKKNYTEALLKLAVYRPESGLINKIDALNVAITSNLTMQRLNIRDSTQPAFFRLISNTDETLDAFKKIGIDYTIDKLISCCPQFLSYLICFEREILGNAEPTKRKELIEKFVNYLNEHIPHLEEIKENFFATQYPEKFMTDSYCNDNSQMEKPLEIIPKYLASLDEIKKIYNAYVEPNMKINSCDEDYHKGAKTYVNQKTVKDLKELSSLKRLFKKQADEKTDVEAAFNALYADLTVAYDYLRKCATDAIAD